MAPTRQEMYTRAQPTGTTGTTTTTTTTKTDSEQLQDREYYFDRGTLNKAYCCQPAGILRILEIAIYGPGPFKGILFGQTFLLIFAGIAVCFSFIFL
ncbi:unnamed protein product, partial [Onchocerca flexuosa]|uniref:Uncharacterized protein n=1 Tax=Onchocerca flexuosa TaxID=387005 RepID=A0A183HWZ5_9BILA